jgi:putative membrane protein
VNGLAACLAALALVAGCEPTGTPPKPKAGDVTPNATERSAGTSPAPTFDPAVQADARALRWTADATRPAPASPASPLSAAERGFINEAAGTGLYEVEGGQMAAARGSQPAVRAFGTMLVTQHRAAHGELQTVARANGITLPINVEADKRSKLDRLARLTGPAFDREFVQVVGIADHEAAVARFTAAGREARDPALRAWIDKTLATLQRHLQEARQLPMLPPG